MEDRSSESQARTMKTLVARIAELELARAYAADESRRLVAVAEATRDIAATRDVDGIIVRLLRAIREPLGFERAMYFTVDRSRGIEPHAQIDGSDAIEPCDEELDLGPASVVLSVLRGEPDGVGSAGELSAPIVDVRRWYVVCALAGNDGTIGLLYADGHHTKSVDETFAHHVRSVASVAAIAIENAMHIAQTQALASRDSLTGLYNRRAFEERLHQTILDAERTQRSFAYVMIDVDDFKSINDRFGHAHGDDVLRSIAATLSSSSRVDDVVGRYAGDEFAIVMMNIDPELARTLVARLCADLRARGLFCSLGAALFPNDARHPRSLMEAADKALYVTKSAGKNGFSFFDARVTLR